MPTEIKVVAAYCRCSTARQEDSPEVQRALISEWAQRNGYVIPPDLWFVDIAVSGGKEAEKRPAFGRLLSMLNAKDRPFDHVVVVRGDRAFRNIEDQLAVLGRMERAGVHLLGVQQTFDQSTPQGRAMSTVMGAFQQLEREMAGVRIKDHCRERVKNHKFAGGQLPIGLMQGPDTDGPLVVNEVELQSVIAAYRAFVDAHGVAAVAARALDAAGVPSPAIIRPRGRRNLGEGWTVATLLRVIRNSWYRRHQVWEEEDVYSPNLIPETVPPELIRQVDSILLTRFGAVNTRKTVRRIGPREARYTYTGLIRCGNCGDYRYVGLDNRRKDKLVWWVCHGKAKLRICSAVDTQNESVDTLVGIAIDSVLGQIAGGHPRKKSAPDSTHVKAKLDALAKRRTRVIETYVDGLITRERRAELLVDIDKEEDNLKRQQSVLTSHIGEAAVTPRKAARLREQFLKIWNVPAMSRADNMEKRAFLTSIGVPRYGITITTTDTGISVEVISVLSSIPAKASADYDTHYRRRRRVSA